jgi:hypothetical protein
MLKPAIGTPQAGSQARLFWLLFAVLDVVAAVGLVLYTRAFGEDTPETRRRAGSVMNGVYAVIALVGVAFLIGVLSASVIRTKDAVSAMIFVLLGGGGLAINLTSKRTLS